MVKKVSSFFKGTYLGLMLLFLYAPILYSGKLGGFYL